MKRLEELYDQHNHNSNCKNIIKMTQEGEVLLKEVSYHESEEARIKQIKTIYQTKKCLSI